MTRAGGGRLHWELAGWMTNPWQMESLMDVHSRGADGVTGFTSTPVISQRNAWPIYPDSGPRRLEAPA